MRVDSFIGSVSKYRLRCSTFDKKCEGGGDKISHKTYDGIACLDDKNLINTTEYSSDDIIDYEDLSVGETSFDFKCDGRSDCALVIRVWELCTYAFSTFVDETYVTGVCGYDYSKQTSYLYNCSFEKKEWGWREYLWNENNSPGIP